MKKLAIAITAVAAFTGSAIAADMPVKARVDAPVVRAMSWTGCYVGVGGGYGMYNQDLSGERGASGFINLGTDETLTLGGRGWFGTGQVGCDYQFAPQWVIGAFGDYDLSSIKGHIFDFDDEKLSSSWAAGARVGYVIMPNLLGYVSGGYTQAHFDAITCAGCSTNVVDAHTYSGWFLGTGYEYGLTWASPNLFWKTEYRFNSYNKDTLQVLSCDGTCTIDSQKWVQTIRSELVWRFNFSH
jgi:outer membrane immunogenic protein